MKFIRLICADTHKPIWVNFALITSFTETERGTLLNVYDGDSLLVKQDAFLLEDLLYSGSSPSSASPSSSE